MVAAATRRLHDPRRIRRVRDMGRVPERALRVWSVSVAVLFARAVRRSAHCVVRRKARMVADASAVLSGADHPAFSRAVSFHVLLLSWRVLQSVLGGSAELRGRRTTQGIQGRALFPADRSEHSSVLPVCRALLSVLLITRRVEGAVVRQWRGRK